MTQKYNDKNTVTVENTKDLNINIGESELVIQPKQNKLSAPLEQKFTSLPEETTQWSQQPTLAINPQKQETPCISD